MEAAPKLPMISFDLKVSTETVSFGPALKQYIATYYKEDPESYNTEIHNLESLRSAAVRPTTDVEGCSTLKKYYCQLHFLKSRFPLEELGPAAVYFSWKAGAVSNTVCSVADIRYELMCILYNIGALHSQLGALDSRNSPEGMKMSCTHYQCAAWAFQTIKEQYYQVVTYPTTIEVINFLQNICLAQAQECILEKSMLDNRKASIIAKVAVQVYEYYRQCLSLLQNSESCFNDSFGSKICKEWVKYLNFKVAYNRCIALLFQGQQAEEQQKMGERVAFYQAASDQLEEAKKLLPQLKHQQEVLEALTFTTDVVEGKRKAAKNENEFIYHEEVPEKEVLQEVKGASLVKGIPFSVNDVEVSGPDIFARLVPMEAHEASSLYSEKKAEMLRQLGELVESKDQALAEFMSSMHLDLLNKMHQASGIPQEIVDRAAALSAKPNATKDLVDAMGNLSNIYHEVESMLNEIEALLKEEEQSEKEYQNLMGKRPPSIIATDLSREAAKYKEAHTKANESNQTLHRAMTAHVANLKLLSQSLRRLQQQLPSIDLPDPHIDENCLKELETLVAKVEEMRTQRAMLWAQFREAVHKDDITGAVVTKQPNLPLEQLFQQELQKHQQLASLIEQNAAAQENIKKALVDSYANALETRRYIQDVLQKRSATITGLISSYDTYEDLLSKANKGIEFYTKLETNVTKLLQRIKSACKVQQEEREQMLSKNEVSKIDTTSSVTPSDAPKLKDYLDSRKKQANITGTYENPITNYNTNISQNVPDHQVWPPAVRPAPLGSEINPEPSTCNNLPKNNEYNYGPTIPQSGYGHMVGNQNYTYSYDNNDYYKNNTQYVHGSYTNVEQDLSNRMNNLSTTTKVDTTFTSMPSQYGQQPYYSHSSYVPQNYVSNYSYTSQSYTPMDNSHPNTENVKYDVCKAFTSTTNSYQPISSPMPNPNADRPEERPYIQYPDGPYTANVQPSVSNSSAYSATNMYQYDTQVINYSQQQNLSSNNTYYPPGYAPNYTNPHNQSDVSDNSEHYSSEYATSVRPNIVGVNSYNSTYSSPVVDTASSNTRLSTNYMSSSSSDGQGYIDANNTYSSASLNNSLQYNQINSYSTPQSNSSYSSNYSAYSTPTQYYADPNYSNYSYGTLQPPSVTTSVPQPTSTPYSSASTVQPNTKESNVDLLSGLDFTISQAPLIPQQNTSPVKSTESNTNTSTTETQIKTASKTTTSTTEKTIVKAEKPVPKILCSKPLNNNDVIHLFNNEYEKYEKYVEVLPIKTLSGPTTLDIKWKEIQEKQDNESNKKSISIARCYPMKNRFSDILPYDHSRVELNSTKDDYINASYIKNVSPYAPPFIVTQAPLPTTSGDFWIMIKEQQVELIFCLLSDKEIADDIYWPTEKGKNLNILNMVISLQNVVSKTHWTERLISVTVPETRESFTVMHLQFNAWPGSLFPTSPEGFLDYVKELITLYQQQRSMSHPVVVHCSSGIGRSGLLCLLATAILDVTNNATSIPDLAALASKLVTYKKNFLRDREHLKFAYESFLFYMKQMISNSYSSTKKLNDVHQEEIILSDVKMESKEDPLNSLDPFWASKK